jgi:hypothetical protein
LATFTIDKFDARCADRGDGFETRHSRMWLFTGEARFGVGECANERQRLGAEDMRL